MAEETRLGSKQLLPTQTQSLSLHLLTQESWDPAKKILLLGVATTAQRVEISYIDVQVFIVVGAIPSTYTRRRRYFGQSGFSNFQGLSRLQNTYSRDSGEKEYRVNVPSYMWTAACCTFRYKDEHGNFQDGTKSKAFFRSNDQGKGACIPATPKTLFKELKRVLNIHKMRIDIIDIFPQNRNC